MILTERQKTIFNKLNIMLAIFGGISFILLIIMAGFYIGNTTINILTWIINAQMVIFIAQEVYRLTLVEEKFTLARQRIIELLVSFVLLLYLFFPGVLMSALNSFAPTLKRESIVVIYLTFTQLPIFMVVARKLLKFGHVLNRLQLYSGLVLTISFATLILFGTFLLMLPKSSPAGMPGVDFIDAFFTATSAVCVTGMTSVDVSSAYSFTGQFFIMMLAQIGGFGVMTITALFAILSSGGISFQMRVMMGDILSEESLSNVSSLVMKIVQYTFCIEFVGAMCLYYSLGGSIFDINADYLFIAVFHAITAFCNAGFSTFSDNMMAPEVMNNFGFLFTISWLIVIGGIGFTVMRNVMNLHPFRRREKRLRYQLTVTTKLILIATAFLIVIPTTIMFFIQDFEFAPEIASLDNFINSLFLAVSARTAGFNNMDIEALAPPVVIVVMVMMMIGAAPGSTAGGIKVTTFAIVWIAFWRMLRGEERLIMFNREIHREYVRKALMIIFAYFVLFALASFIIALIETDKPLLNLVFEVVSALSTVGLSRNTTMLLGTGGKVILICLMFIGRVGVLCFFLAFHKPKMPINKKLPKTSVIIG